MAGHISYPRTDNTVYPSSLDLREALEILAQGEFRARPGDCWSRRRCTPAGATSAPPTTRPSTPRAAPAGGELGDREWRLYELVARRFMATLADEAVMESNRVDLALSGEPFFARGNRVVTAGWLDYYPYSRQKDLELPLLEKGDLVALGRQAVGRQGDPAAVALRAGYAHRAHGEAQSGHQGHAARHHPEPVRPGLRARQPRGADRDGHEDGRGPAGVRAPHRLPGDDRRAGEGHGPHLRARPHQGAGGDHLARPAAPGLRLPGAEPGADGRQDLRGHHRRPHPGRLPQVREEQDPHHPLEGHQEALRGLRGLPGLRSDLSAAPAGRRHRHRGDLPAVRQPQGEDPGRPPAVDPVPRSRLPHQGRVPREAGGPGGEGQAAADGEGAATGKPVRKTAAKKTTKTGAAAAKKPPTKAAATKTAAAKKPAAKKTAVTKTATASGRARKALPPRTVASRPAPASEDQA